MAQSPESGGIILMVAACGTGDLAAYRYFGSAADLGLAWATTDPNHASERIGPNTASRTSKLPGGSVPRRTASSRNCLPSTLLPWISESRAPWVLLECYKFRMNAIPPIVGLKNIRATVWRQYPATHCRDSGLRWSADRSHHCTGFFSQSYSHPDSLSG
jgi:hypothetical protein